MSVSDTARDVSSSKIRWGVLIGVLLALLVVGFQKPPVEGTSTDRLFNLGDQIRCPQCSGESVTGSNVEIAKAMRSEISERMELGESDDEILSYFASKYGPQILLSPSSNGITGLIWVLPVVAAAGALAVVGYTYFGRQTAQVLAAPTRLRWVKIALGATFVGGVVVVVAQMTSERGEGQSTVAGTSIDEQLAACNASSETDCYDDILKQAPRHPEALTYKGWAQVREGEVAAGLANIDKAIESDPSLPDARVFAASANLQEENVGEAKEQMRQFWALDPPPGMVSLVEQMGLDFNIEVASLPAYVRKCLEIDDDSPLATLRCFDNAGKQNPDDLEVKSLRAALVMSILGANEIPSEGAADLQTSVETALAEILEAEPRNPEALALSALLSIDDGKSKSARKFVKQLKSTNQRPSPLIGVKLEDLETALTELE